MKNLKLILATTALCCIHITTYAIDYVLTNDCAASLSVTVTNTVKLGKKIEVSYELSSATNMPQFFMDHLALDDIGVFVFDHEWKLMPTKVQYPAKQPQFPEVNVGGSTRIRIISKEPHTASFDLGQYCDIREPGTYRVMVVCPVQKVNGPFKCEIPSIPATFIVLP